VVLKPAVQIVKRGDMVVLKPAVDFDMIPDTKLATNPFPVREIINQCYEAGAKAVSIFDQTNNASTKCYKNSGIERIAKDTTGRVLPFKNELFNSEVKSGKPKIF